MSVSPPDRFTIHVPQAALTDLADRLERTRWPEKIPGRRWEDGADVDYVREICGYWRSGFDWRRAESRLNAMDQYTAAIDGLDIHFVHIRGRGPGSRPLLLAHGWPSSFLEFEKILPMLTDPARNGGDPTHAFDVVIPSMPGFGFSQAPGGGGVNTGVVAGLWVKLMRDVLGYERFFAHGGDIGAHVVNALGRHHAAHVAAIHTMAAPTVSAIPHPSDDERAWLDRVGDWERMEGGYWHLQRTKPQSLAVGLNDSPAGLAAWILEKWHGWSECDGRLESVFARDDLLSLISLYWFTRTIGSSMRMYYETAHTPPPSNVGIEVPARLLLTREEVDLCPPEYAHRAFRDLSYAVAERGGHFLAAEEPALLAADIGRFFSTCTLDQEMHAGG